MTIDLLTFRHLLEINRDYPNIRNVLVLGNPQNFPSNWGRQSIQHQLIPHNALTQGLFPPCECLAVIHHHIGIARRAKGNRKRNITDIVIYDFMPCHIAQEIGAWGLPGQLECDHRFSGGNIGVARAIISTYSSAGMPSLPTPPERISNQLSKLVFEKFVSRNSYCQNRGSVKAAVADKIIPKT